MLTKRLIILITTLSMFSFSALFLILGLTGVFSTVPSIATPTIHVHYIAAIEEDWDYLPKQTDLSRQRFKYAERNMEPSHEPRRIGKLYKKALFREYTDDTYSTRKAREPWLGIMGPLLKAEVGDVLEIHLMNNASHPVSLHSHGVHYEKNHEGAIYNDNEQYKTGDKVLPGQKYTYYWQVPEDRGPTASDSDCMIWAYHSHITGDNDIYTGLIGPLILCRTGYLHQNNADSSYPDEYILLFLIFDENQSWYLNDNMVSNWNNTSEDEIEIYKEDESFMASNRMYSINGYMYDNLPGLEMCLGSEVTWHLMAMGNEVDIHAITFNGHSITVNGHRTDTVHLFPGKFVTAKMMPAHSSKWAIKSEVGDHFHAGMEASFKVHICPNGSSENEIDGNGKYRKYFIAAEEILWNYAPSGMNLVTNVPIDQDSESAEFFVRNENRIGGTYKKVVYRQYKDETFDLIMPVPRNYGLLGPTIRAEVGDVLEITFLNRASRQYSFQSTAFVPNSCSRGDNGTLCQPVNPNENMTLSFTISKRLGPSDSDPDCIPWRYFSDADSLKDSYSGLNGFLLTCRPGSLDNNGKQRFADKEFFLMFAVMDENEAHYIDENIALFTNGSEYLDRNDDFVESNLMHSINGLMYGNLMGLDLCANENVSWYIMAIGHEVDLHVAHFFGNVFSYHGTHRDTIELLPGSHVSLTMLPHAVGEWPLQCQTNDHIIGGMKIFYTVQHCGGETDHSPNATGQVREYYIAAVEEVWDYAPTTFHPVTGEKLEINEDSKIFVTTDETHIGSKYVKALFREFTDSTFQYRKPRNDRYVHLGFLGPQIKSEIGDVIRIVFFNNASREYNIRPHGVTELLNSDTSLLSDAVKPSETRIYTWEVKDTAGPSESGFNCTNWIYYSSVDPVKDTNSGLVGPLLVCKRGVLKNDGFRKDVDREFSVLYTVMDENQSWYLQDNVFKYCKQSENVDIENEDFNESNLKHSINGRIYASLEGLNGTVGDKVAWYLMGMGTEIDIHSAHFHGLVGVEKMDVSRQAGHREDVVDLFPGIFRTVEMTFDTRGKWMFHCHVDDHLKAGMFSFVNVS